MNKAPFAKLETIGKLAGERGVSWWTMWRLLRSLAAADLASGEKRKWLFRYAADATDKKNRGQWRVNRSMLRAVHPEIFETRERVVQDLTDRVDRLEKNDAAIIKRQNGLAAALRRHVSACKVVQTSES